MPAKFICFLRKKKNQCELPKNNQCELPISGLIWFLFHHYRSPKLIKKMVNSRFIFFNLSGCLFRKEIKKIIS